ncbi:MAG TPA: hypothetical protein VGG64_05465 [Pirellulales bacterium]|jgi:hypothetical protein
MPLELQNKQSVRSVMRPILLAARDEDLRENPNGTRHPFFHPVSIQFDNGHRLMAFSRDLSGLGIGLLHEVPLPLEEVAVSIKTGRGYHVKVRISISWCRPCGDGHYISGGQFTSVPTVGEE